MIIWNKENNIQMGYFYCEKPSNGISFIGGIHYFIKKDRVLVSRGFNRKIEEHLNILFQK